MIRADTGSVVRTILGCLVCWGGAVLAAERPNFVFIFTDDHCQQALSAYDPSRTSTPNLDRIAREGMRFERCYVTNGICGPSRAVIQTGKYSHVNGFMVNGQSFDGSQQTFPKLLRQAGYETAVIGKWHLESDPQGFDHWDILLGQGPYYNPPMKTVGPDGRPQVRPHVGYTTDLITDKALAWLKEGRDASRPFLLMCQHKAPHREWAPGPKYLDWLDDVEVPEPATLWDDYANRASPAAEQAMTVRQHLNDTDLKLVPPKNLTPEQLERWNAAYAAENEAFRARRATMTEEEIVKWKYQRYVKDYLRCVRSVDDGVGALLDALDEAGLAENTVVVYSSDQGWYLGEHGWFDKRWMYEESLKTPLLVRWPGVAAPGSVNRDIVSNLDFAETFLDAAGLPVPGDMQGRSFVPLLRGRTPDDWRQTFYYHYYEFPGAHSVARHYGVTDGSFKLIHYYEKGEWELFDLARDPHELRSEYANPEFAPRVAAMKEELERLRRLYRLPEEDPPESRRPAGKQRVPRASGTGS
jgi:arylsulfatase A-like enzyme